MTLTVFTAIVGGKTDQLKAPLVVNPDVRYVVFSDHAQAVAPYEWIPIEVTDLGPRLRARQLKICANHPALGRPGVILWHDAAFQLAVDPAQLASEQLVDGHDLCAFPHPDRTRIEDEAIAIARHGYASLEDLQRQAETYRAEGFQQTALTATGFILRRMTPAVKVFDAVWWDEVARWTWRDQMSVDFAAWKTGVVIHYLPGHYRDNALAPWFKW